MGGVRVGLTSPALYSLIEKTKRMKKKAGILGKALATGLGAMMALGTPAGGYYTRVRNRAKEDGFPSRAAAREAMLARMEHMAHKMAAGDHFKIDQKLKRYLPGVVRSKRKAFGRKIEWV